MVVEMFSSLLVSLAFTYSSIIHCTLGDAILAFWRCDRDNSQIVTTVVEKCLSIQKQHDNYQVSDDVNLRMKLSVGVGDVFIYHLGKHTA